MAISESFNTADSTTIGPDLAWTEINGDWEIVSNQCRGGGATGTGATGVLMCTTAATSEDHEASLTIVANGVSALDVSAAGVLVRGTLASGGTYYGAQVYNGNGDLQLNRVINGTSTTIATLAITASYPEIYRLVVSGVGAAVNLKVYQAGVLRIDYDDTAGSRIVSSSKLMGAHYYNRAIFDAFSSPSASLGGGIAIVPITCGMRQRLNA